METILFDEDGFGVGQARIRWSEIEAVAIHTTDVGPFAEDLHWMLVLPSGIVELPQLLVTSELLGAFQAHLPGLDSVKIIRAMGSTDERIFRIWHRLESPRGWNRDAARTRFVALVARLGGVGADGSAESAFVELCASWEQTGRPYHNTEHLADCLRELDDAHPAPAIADLAELALWYHDAVYDAQRRDNEERSALLLQAHGGKLGIAKATIDAAAALVRATAHSGPAPSGAAAELVNDIDLSILGRDALRFMDYEHSIAEEYAHVPSSLFYRERRRLLASFLAAPFIYHTDEFRRRYEAVARRNLTSLLASPRYRQGRFTAWLRSIA